MPEDNSPTDLPVMERRQLKPNYRDANHRRERPPGKQREKSRLRRLRVAAAVLALVLIIVAGGAWWWIAARGYESTDDAFIDARQFAVAAKVGGYVTEVLVDDNQHVAAGATLVRIDPRDYEAALHQAEAQVSEAHASVANVAAQISEQQAQVKQAEAQVAQAAAALQFSQQENQRSQTLAGEGAGTLQRAQQTSADLRQKQANVDAARATVTAARRQNDVLLSQQVSADASLRAAKAAREKAQLDLTYTDIKAAQSGHVAQLAAATGQFAQPGQALMMFVPDRLWVTANFKETQITNMRPGQPVEVTIDAYPNRKFKGHVDSIQAGSGTAFSLLPAENATGNFVKVTQRVPVKIVLDHVPADVALGPGMSVEPRVKVG